MRTGLAVFIVALASLLPSFAQAAECRALIIAGDPGSEPNSAKRFDDWTGRWDALLKKAGFKAENVRVLRSPSKRVAVVAEDNRMAATLSTTAPTTRKVGSDELASLANVRAAVGDLLKASTPEDQVVIILIGHGYMERETISKFSLPGPDLTDVEFGQALAPLKAKQLVVMSFAPMSTSWAKALKEHTQKQDRVIITSQLGSQTYFSEFMLRALEKQNGSLLSAFNNAVNGTGKNGVDAGLFWYYSNVFLDPKHDNQLTISGTANQQIFRHLYPERSFDAGESEPQQPQFDMEERDPWVNRRVIPEVPGLEDDGDGEPSITIMVNQSLDEKTKGTRLMNLPYMREEEDVATGRPASATRSGGTRTDGDIAGRVILGKP